MNNNRSTIIGFVLIFAIMMGFSWYQTRQYNEQMAVQAQLDSIARAEQMAAMALDSLNYPQTDGSVPVKVMNMPAYKDSLLTEARLAEAQICKIGNDKLEIEFSTKGAQPYSVKINDYIFIRHRDLTDKVDENIVESQL